MIDCYAAEDLIPLYIDNELSEESRAQLEEHMLSCGPCKSKYEEIRALIVTLRGIEDIELPEGFHKRLMDRLPEKAKPLYKLWDYKRILMTASSAAAALILVSVLSIGLNGLAGNNNTQGSNAPQLTMQTRAEIEAPTGKVGSEAYSAQAGVSLAAAPAAGAGGTQNFITTFNITLTVDDVQKAMDTISRLSGAQASMSYSMPAYEGAQGSASVTRRVASQDYEAVKNQLRDLGEVTNESETRQNMTRQLSDLNAQLTAKDEQKDRMLTLLGKSGDIDTMAKVEARLYGLADESDSLNTQIRGINAQIGQPYVNIQLYNRVYVPPAQPMQPLGARIANSFKWSVNETVRFSQGMLMFVVMAAVPLLSCAAVIVIIFLVFRYVKKRRDRRFGQ